MEVAPTASAVTTLELVTKEVQVLGSLIYGVKFEIGLRIHSIGAADVSPFAASVWPLVDASGAFGLMSSSTSIPKILLSPGGLDDRLLDPAGNSRGEQ